MILGFEDETTGTVVSGRCPKGFPADPFKVARRRLGYLDAAIHLEASGSPPGNRSEALKDEVTDHH